MRLPVDKYINGIKGSVGSSGFEPGSLYAFLIVLQAKAGAVAEFLQFARGAVKTDDEDRLLDNVERGLDAFNQRLVQYEAFLLPLMQDGETNPRLSIPVENPVFRGAYGPQWKLPGGSPLCAEGAECKHSTPDLATPIVLMNEIDHIVELSLENWQMFLVDLKDTYREAAAGAVGGAAYHEKASEHFKFTERTIEQLVDDSKKHDTTSDIFNPWKWALIGGATALGLLGTYKLLK